MLEGRLDEADLLELSSLLDEPSVHRVYEDDGNTLRSVYGLQQVERSRAWLCAQSWMRGWLTALLGPQVYLYQSKINLKNRLSSSIWPYHRDFPFWHVFDGVPESRMLNIAIYRDEVTPECGPLKLLSASHRRFLDRERLDAQTRYTVEASAGANLAFSFSDEEMAGMRSSCAEHRAEGPRGSVLLFDPQVVHGSEHSTRDASRRMMLLTFNACDNLPTRTTERPDFLCARDCRPVQWTAPF